MSDPDPPIAAARRQASRWPERFLLRAQGRGREAGLTLIEVVVSALMVVLIGGAVATALVSTAHYAGDQRFRSQADSIAAQDQDRLRGLSDEQLNGLNQTRTEPLNGTMFTVTSKASYLDTTGGTSCSSTAASYYKIVSTVSWPEGFSSRTPSVTVSSLLSRPVSGDLLTQVTDQTGQPLSGVSVTPSGPSTQTAQTDNNGCVLFAGLTAGAYTVGVSYQNWVDPNGNNPGSGTATVNSTGLAQPNGGVFHLGNPGSITGTFTTSTAGAGGEADGLAYSGSGSSYSMSSPLAAPTTAPATPATSIQAGSLFPFEVSGGYTGNYTVWAGRCPGQEPPTQTVASVSPGGTSAVNVPEPLLNVSSVTLNSKTTKPADVKLTFNDGSCTDSWYTTLTSATAAPATGWLAYPGQPYAASGTLTVCADVLSGGQYWHASVSAANTNFSAANAVGTIAISSSRWSGGLSGKC